ncbi:hypothetical protein RRG08_026207 [Elysia crispata]|uniref:Uncharacterized protein n=1 Tax=Elysia crispata TaxID=231223 RepID=A0AAE1DCR7_9GAST|nr:hypothetical protein RRG08_026207 [Elysia crispata]
MINGTGRQPLFLGPHWFLNEGPLPVVMIHTALTVVLFLKSPSLTLRLRTVPRLWFQGRERMARGKSLATAVVSDPSPRFFFSSATPVQAHPSVTHLIPIPG